MRSAGISPGATVIGDGRTRFVVWAPWEQRVSLVLRSRSDRVIPMERVERGYHVAQAEAGPGDRYVFRLHGRGVDRPDPASRSQPEGVHGPSEVVDDAFPWTDAGWTGVPLDRLVLYELHVGTYTDEGTFDGVVHHLETLRDLGVTAVELMPVAQFPGRRNWGYDQAYPFAVQGSYGGTAGLKRLVDACHSAGLALVLDVVYNHLGPEGNYLADFGPYFTDRHRTPWGLAINFDGPGSDEVRSFFQSNALRWVKEFHVDGLRLDAIHGIVDTTARPFLAELSDAVRTEAGALGRKIHLIAECDRNDPAVVRPVAEGGLGLDAVFNDDFHHAVHAILTGERAGYYADFGSPGLLAKAVSEGFAFSGEYSVFRGRRHGASSRDIPGRRLIIFAQNHDQVGNRAAGERLDVLVPAEAARLAAALVCLSPYVPLLFMGQEYGESAPFLYFVDHSDPALVEAVRRGRREEFAVFHQEASVPDPADPATFEHSRIRHDLASTGPRRAMRDWWRELLRLRRWHPALAALDKEAAQTRLIEPGPVLELRRRHGRFEALVAVALGEGGALILPDAPGGWTLLLDSLDPRWSGPAAALAGDAVREGGARVTLSRWQVMLFDRRS